MKLYGYWRSSTSWRVRIALALKGLDYDYAAVHLVEQGGQHRTQAYRELNPMAQVPLLEVEIGGQTRHIGQSLAIIEHLEEAHPDPALLPADPFERARARQLAEIVNSGIHPLQNLSMIQRLGADFDVDARAWCAQWIRTGFEGYERLVQETAGDFSVGDRPTVADLCLVPQLYNARRFDVDLAPYPTLLAIEQRCEQLDAFQAAHPDEQPDAVVN